MGRINLAVLRNSLLVGYHVFQIIACETSTLQLFLTLSQSLIQITTVRLYVVYKSLIALLT